MNTHSFASAIEQIEAPTFGDGYWIVVRTKGGAVITGVWRQVTVAMIGLKFSDDAAEVFVEIADIEVVHVSLG